MGTGQLLQGLEMGCKGAVGSEYTWVLCWTDSWTIGEIASSRSVGMIVSRVESQWSYVQDLQKKCVILRYAMAMRA